VVATRTKTTDLLPIEHRTPAVDRTASRLAFIRNIPITSPLMSVRLKADPRVIDAAERQMRQLYCPLTRVSDPPA
jgi:hypothetical protein